MSEVFKAIGEVLNTAGRFAVNSAIDLANTAVREVSDYVQDIGLDNPLSLEELNDSSLGQSKYDFSWRTFPEDIGTSSYNGHYMVININVSQYSSMGNVNYGSDPINTYARLGELSKVDSLRSSIDGNFTNSNSGRTLGIGRTYIPRQTRRIVESVALFMPSTVVFTNANQYEDISLTGIAKNVAGYGIPGMAMDTAESVAGLAQSPINPRVEVIFSNTALRQFQFDFLFAPASEQESRSMEEIIRTLRFHAAPEVNNFSGNNNNILGPLQGLLWTPPSEFDITFFNKGVENTNIPRINTCVLENVDVDYAPTGVYSTFQNGHPVRARMQLKFREVEVNHKLRIIQGF